jgi:hypothetical protein
MLNYQGCLVIGFWTTGLSLQYYAQNKLNYTGSADLSTAVKSLIVTTKEEQLSENLGYIMMEQTPR